jgi:hypothetical protein
MAGCDTPPGKDAAPPVPAALVYKDENPLGDAANADMTRAGNAARDQLEPRWGPLKSRLYLLPATGRDGFAAQVEQGLPSGWTAVGATPVGARGATLLTYAKGDRMLAYLLLDRPAGDFYPVQRFDN